MSRLDTAFHYGCSGIDGRDASDKGGKVLFASFDKRQAESQVTGWSYLKPEILEDYEQKVRKVLDNLDPVTRLLAYEAFLLGLR